MGKKVPVTRISAADLYVLYLEACEELRAERFCRQVALAALESVCPSDVFEPGGDIYV